LLVAHRARHVHHVDDDRVVLVALVSLPRPEAEVLLDRNDDRAIGVVSPCRDLAAQGLAERALKMSERVRPLASNAGIALGLGLQSLMAAWLDLRQLKLLA